MKGLLHSWSSNLNGDLLALLSKLDVESSSEVGILYNQQIQRQICKIFLQDTNFKSLTVAPTLNNVP